MKKFVDYYDLLHISPDADSEIIERVFRLLAKRYHPDNPDTNNRDKFDLVSEAHAVSSDPAQRAAYDAGYETQKTQQQQRHYQSIATGDVDDVNLIRYGMLSALYQERKNTPSDPGMGQWQLEKIIGWPEEVLAFHIWYLRGKKWIETLENGMLAITPDGVDAYENSEYYRGRNQLLPAPETIDGPDR